MERKVVIKSLLSLTREKQGNVKSIPLVLIPLVCNRKGNSESSVRFNRLLLEPRKIK